MVLFVILVDEGRFSLGLNPPFFPCPFGMFASKSVSVYTVVLYTSFSIPLLGFCLSSWDPPVFAGGSVRFPPIWRVPTLVGLITACRGFYSNLTCSLGSFLPIFLSSIYVALNSLSYLFCGGMWIWDFISFVRSFVTQILDLPTCHLALLSTGFTSWLGLLTFVGVFLLLS